MPIENRTKIGSTEKSSYDLLDTSLLIICSLVSFAVCWYFHDKGWLAVDDGYYGYVSQRILEGDVIHRDFQGLHPGLIFLINTLSLKFAGGDLVGLRYPLIAITIAQSVLGYKIARKNGQLAAVIAALVLTAFSFLQFINPTGNWYALFLAVLLAYLLDSREKYSLPFIAFIGFIVGIMFLFRQYSGAMAAIAVTIVVFTVNSEPKTDHNKYSAGRNLLIILMIVTSIFLASSGHITGFLIIGIFPIIIMGISVFRVNTNFETTIKTVATLFFGAFLSAIPLIIYHLIHGSLVSWITDLTVENFILSSMDVFDLYRYGTLPLFALISLIKGELNAIGGLAFWSFMLFAPTLLGITTVSYYYKNPNKIPVVSIFACFYALVSVIFEAPVYLVYSSGLVLLALLSGETIPRNLKLISMCGILSIAAIAYQAGETKQITKFTAKNERLLETSHLIPGTSVKVGSEESAKYERLVDLVESCTFESEKVYAFPISPEINFLTKREYPFRSFILMLLLRTDQDVEIHAQEILDSDALALILHDEDEKFYNTPNGFKLLKKIASEYNVYGYIEGFTVYHRKNHPKSTECASSTFDQPDENKTAME